MNNHHRLVIIGSGPAALTAGIYSARAQLQPLILEGNAPGGQLMGTTYVENWPGEKKILGPTLMMNMRSHAEELGCQFLAEEVVSITTEKPFVVTTKRRTLTADALIVATGSTPNKLGCPGEQEYWGKGVTTCAVCDGAFYKDKPVVIIGGGDTAMEDASFMTKFTNQITIVHILDSLTASKPMQERVLNNKDIRIIYNSTVTEFIGNGTHVTQATVVNQATKESSTLAIAAAFIAIGLRPQTTFLHGIVALDRAGYVITEPHTSRTSVPGIFAAGDVQDFRYRQAITSAGSGCMAALDAERYLSHI